MNLKRFTGRTTRDALALVRQAFGEDAVVMSTKPCAEGVEVLAMAPESMAHLERLGAGAPAASPAATAFRDSAFANSTFGGASPPRAGGYAERIEPTLDAPRGTRAEVAADVQQMQMSTLSFQDYVRERMLKRRQAELQVGAPAPAQPPPGVSPITEARARLAAQQAQRAAARAGSERSDRADESRFADSSFADSRFADAPSAAPPYANPPGRPSRFADTPAADKRAAGSVMHTPGVARAAAIAATMPGPARAQATQARHVASQLPELHQVAPVARPEPPVRLSPPSATGAGALSAMGTSDTMTPRAATEARMDQTAMLNELRSMRGLIEQRFGALAFMEKLQREPRQAQLTQRLLDAGFSPALTRRLTECLPAEVDEMAWAAGVLERNLGTGERDAALEDAGGVYALIGATGVGKTTSTAKLAAAFATKHGAGNLGLITLDAYRVAAHEQLRTYGRILGVPVHTAHDRASLEDLLELLSGKRMVLIDTAGMAQRDTRTRELLEMLQRPSIQRLVVVSAAAQGETIEDQLTAYAAPGCRGVVLSKVDEAVKLAPALDAMIRARLKVLAVANGQRVPEDWHRLSAHALVQRALRAQAAPAWRMEPGEVKLVFAGQPSAPNSLGQAAVGAPSATGANAAAASAAAVAAGSAAPPLA